MAQFHHLTEASNCFLRLFLVSLSALFSSEIGVLGKGPISQFAPKAAKNRLFIMTQILNF